MLPHRSTGIRIKTSGRAIHSASTKHASNFKQHAHHLHRSAGHRPGAAAQHRRLVPRPLHRAAQPGPMVRRAAAARLQSAQLAVRARLERVVLCDWHRLVSGMAARLSQRFRGDIAASRSRCARSVRAAAGRQLAVGAGVLCVAPADGGVCGDCGAGRGGAG